MSFSRAFPRALLRRSYGTVQSSPSAASIASKIPLALQEATAATAPRTTWTRDEVQQIYHTPLNQLTYAAVRSHPNITPAPSTYPHILTT